MGSFAVPTSQQHITAGFMLVTMEIVVVASRAKFLAVAFSLSCLPLFQSKFMKIMFAAAVLCISGTVPCSVATGDLKADHGDGIASLVE